VWEVTQYSENIQCIFSNLIRSLKKFFFFFLMLPILVFLSLSVPVDIKLNSPNLNRGLVFSQTVQNRHSERTFSSTSLSLQDLSDLFWSVGGVNRPDSGYLVNPTAVNYQDLTIYGVFPQGIYSYDKKAHYLRGVVDGDYRQVVATSEQPTIANAPVILLIVSDLDAFWLTTEDEAERLSALDSGIAAQTALLFAASNGFVTVPRAMMDTQSLAKVLGLSARRVIQLNVPIGYSSS
jgi:nitroreductase